MGWNIVYADTAFRLNVGWETATPEQIGIYAPTNASVAAGSTVSVRHRIPGGSWVNDHPLMRLSTTGNEAGGPTTIVDAFAGCIFGLTEGTTYDVELTLVESGQPDSTSTSQRTTRSLPAAAGSATVTATTSDSLQTKFNALSAGAVLELAVGTYTVSALTLSNSGSSGSPIYIRGVSRSGVIIKDTTGTVLTISASHVIIENLTIEGSSSNSGEAASSHGIDISGARTNVTIREIAMVGVDVGINADSEQTGALVYQNNLAGNNVWSDAYAAPPADNDTWNDDGICLPGFGNCAWNNTIDGFGDSLSVQTIAENGSQRAEGIYFYRNRIDRNCDDVIEFDYGTRNIACYDNKITNCATAMSISPGYAGPFWYFRNIVVNSIRGPIKNNNDTTGFIVYNNTFRNTDGSEGWTWVQYNNGAWQNYSYRNNLHIGETGVTQLFANETTDNNPCDFSHNGWYPDGDVLWTNAGGSFASLAAARSGLASVSTVFGSVQRHVSDVIVTVADPFATDITLGASYTTEYTAEPDATLTAATTPKNAGIAIPGITDGFSGAAPDMGAIIAGRTAVTYGHQPAWMTGLATFTWKELAGTDFDQLAAFDVGVFAYSGAAADNDGVWVWGGGHSDSDNNGVFYLNLRADTPVVQTIRAGTGTTRTDDDYYADGRPSARHTYQTLAWIGQRNRLMSFTANSVYGSGPVKFETVDGFNPDTGDWDAAGTWTSAPSGTADLSRGMCKSQDGNENFYTTSGGAFRRWNQAANTWTTINASITDIFDRTVAHDPVNGRVVMFASTGRRWDTTSGTETTFSFTGAAAANAQSGSWVWCPDTGGFIGKAWNSGTTIYQCTTAFVATTLSISGSTPPAPTADGYGELNGRFGYCPGLRVIYYIPRSGSNCWVFRTG